MPRSMILLTLLSQIAFGISLQWSWIHLLRLKSSGVSICTICLRFPNPIWIVSFINHSISSSFVVPDRSLYMVFSPCQILLPSHLIAHFYSFDNPIMIHYGLNLSIMSPVRTCLQQSPTCNLAAFSCSGSYMNLSCDKHI